MEHKPKSSSSKSSSKSLLEQSKLKLLEELNSISAMNETQNSDNSFLDSTAVNEMMDCSSTVSSIKDDVNGGGSTDNSDTTEPESSNSNSVCNNTEKEIKLNEEETSIYNFESPFMAMEIKDCFQTSNDNFTKGCKW